MIHINISHIQALKDKSIRGVGVKIGNRTYIYKTRLVLHVDDWCIAPVRSSMKLVKVVRVGCSFDIAAMERAVQEDAAFKRRIEKRLLECLKV